VDFFLRAIAPSYLRNSAQAIAAGTAVGQPSPMETALKINSIFSTSDSAKPNKSLSPPPVLDTIALPNGGHCRVLRDDLLPGGTKQRALVPFLTELASQGCEEFVYASPFAGFAQVALAACTRLLGLKTTIFCEQVPPELGGADPLHEFSRLACSFGANVTAINGLGQAELAAQAYSQEKSGRVKIPLGFDHPRFHFFMQAALGELVTKILAELNPGPSAIWLPVGSGTLTRAITPLLPNELQINLVDVRVLPPLDPRIHALEQSPRYHFRRAPELFAERAWEAAPVPANLHYDAKLWAFIQRHANSGDVWWNVAR